MKKILLLFVSILLSSGVISVSAQLKVEPSGKVTIGETISSGSYYDVLKVFTGITIDANPTSQRFQGLAFRRYGTTSVGDWGIDMDFEGLNFWRPYPRSNFGNCKLIIKETGCIGVQNCYPAYELDVTGIIRANSFLVNSDLKLKKNVIYLSDCLSKISQLNAASYQLQTNSTQKGMYEKDGVEMSKDAKMSSIIYKKQYGLIAQEVREIIPEVVEEDKYGMLSVDYIALIPMLIGAIKEQQAQIEELRNGVFPKQLRSSSGVDNTTDLETTVVSNNQLFQNIPNPFSINTTINYYLTGNVQKANLYIYDMQGKQIKNYPLQNKGEGNVLIQGSELNAGMYIYTLIVDGKEVDTKRMILTE